MTPLAWIMVASALGLAALTAFAVVAVRRTHFRPADGIRITRVDRGRLDVEQYMARTPAGPAVITRVWGDDRGEEYKLETDFGGRVEHHYSPPHLPVARRDLAQLAADHLARQEVHRADA